MALDKSNPTAHPDMLTWQYRTVIGELQNLQLHVTDPTCPCTLADLGEFCVPKHLLTISSMAGETSAMDAAHFDLWAALQEEAVGAHQLVRDYLMHPERPGKEMDLLGWSRGWRKKLEDIYYHDKDGKRPKKTRLHQALEEIVYPTGDMAPTIIQDEGDGPGLSGVIPPELAEYKIQTYVTRDPNFDPLKAVTITSPSDLQPFFRLIRNADREWVLAFFVDTRNRLVGALESNIGERDQSLVSVDAIFEAALRVNASGIFIVHNHPSCDASPSSADRAFFVHLQSKCNFPNLRILDMVIVGCSMDYSIRGERFLDAIGPGRSPFTVTPPRKEEWVITPTPPVPLIVPTPKRGQGKLLESLQVITLEQAGGGVSDPFGSRCRDPKTGLWTDLDLCGVLDKAAPYGKFVGTVVATTSAISADGLRKYDLEHRVVEAKALIPSHDPFTFALNPAYSQKLQPRMRDRAAAELQVKRIAAQLSPDALLTDYHTLDRGAPIVGPDMVVESGNGRTMGLLRSIMEFPDNYAAYRKALEERVESFGIDPKDVASMEAPVLVRVRLTALTPEERQAFAVEANTPSGISRSAIEQARTDSEKVTLAMLERLDVREGESIFDALRAARNDDFIRSFLSGVPENERGQLLDAQGRINQDGIRRASQALFVAAFGSGEAGLRLGAMAFESADEDVRNIFNAISRSLAPLAKAESLVRTRSRDATLTIGEDLAKTIAVFAKIKNDSSLTVQKYLDQSQMFTRELDPFQEVLLQVLSKNIRSAVRLGAIFAAYANLVLDQPAPEQMGMFGALDRPTKEQLWVLATERGSMPADKPVLVAAQGPTEIRGAFSRRIRWCNTKEDAQGRILQWRPLRDLLFTGLTYLVAVEVCEAGFGGDQYQVTIGYPAQGITRKGTLTAGQMEAIRKLALKMGSVTKEVRTRDPGLLVYQVTIPSMDEGDLVLKPQLTKKESDERARRAESIPQPALFQEEILKLLPIIEKALAELP